MLAGTGAAGAVALTATGCGTTPKPQDALRGTVVAQTTDVPEGGGLLLMDAKLVITQPEPGTFLAFSASCTHGGCTVQEVTTEILCLCHHSKFGLDGEVLQGPAVDPLEQFEVKVEGTDIILV
ncbi:Rieske (2Fe-2S) protein [Thermobifida fusca]|jgi:Rieske Fe-S protein|uniref:Cytochrome bc1 complex Rieske iron-sulfur subunit n=2 Tax=Thermobifida fusca TaxID=2021 RepID=A0A9P2WQD5_THEFU|nr:MULTISPECIES: Rieske (2Fe-2S) protein [Thermobifida]EOR70879.1 iron-sulfur protein [Thermobifida fusca TM51]MBO2530645.1 Rieske (2Fe-2S) protein [Thermobifida sp.]PZN65029.1 MAG: Rieske (2Fe-2S) protein [Thermobifida fusca]QOS58545.1 Rieske (2Fe-2S) protein [Thermobifida fusca]